MRSSLPARRTAIASWLAVAAGLAVATALPLRAQRAGQSPDTVEIQSGTLRLRGLLWRPDGPGPFPAVLFNHGSGPAGYPLRPDRIALGPVFPRHGYVFLFLFARGAGLSAQEGANSFDVMSRALEERGQEARNQVQLRRLETDDLDDALAGLAFLRAVRGVDPRRVAVAGHSFGGSLTLLLAERDSTLRAAVVYGAAGGSWERSPPLRQRLRAAVSRGVVPVFFAYAANDYSVAAGRTLAGDMVRLRKRHRLEIYPAVGETVEAGHDLVYRAASVWERDVFAFLNEYVRK